MDPERLEKVQELYHLARACEPAGYDTFLAQACHGDEDLRRDVEALLAQDSAGLMQRPAMEIAASLLADPTFMPVPVGTQLGPYQIESALGAGGMGQVYKARDTRLGRAVAIKIINQRFSERFEREARAISGLNHPHVCTLYDVGPGYLVMEFVEGETLAARLERGRLPMDDVVRYGAEIAEALSSAHASGIIHRDLKPANLMVTKSGIKVLDFGLAQMAQVDGGLTATNAIMGSPPYMAPEQWEGKRCDARTDIYTLGLVLYEMATGKQLTRGETPILDNFPERFAHLIERCLANDPEHRWQSAKDVKSAIEWVGKKPGAAHEASRKQWVWVALLILVVACGFFAWRNAYQPGRSEPLQVVPITTYPGAETEPSLSPDGNQVAFRWSGPRQDNEDIYVQIIGSGPPLQLTNEAARDHSPAWSPDGRWIAFLRGNSPGKNELRLIAPLGGPERKLAEIQIAHILLPAPYMTWSADGRFLIVTDSPGDGQPNSLFSVALDTGEKRRLTTPPATASGDTTPAVSADGRSLVFGRFQAVAAGEIHWASVAEDLTIVGDPRRLTQAKLFAAQPTWLSKDEIVFSVVRDGLWRMNASGESVPSRLAFVGQDGVMPVMSRPQPGTPARLVYVRSFVDRNIWRVTRSAPGLSKPQVAISSTRVDYDAQFSPDGRRVAFASDRSGNMEIWLANPDGSGEARITSMGAPETGTPRWSPDGQTIAFDSNFEGQFEIHAVSVMGGKPRRLTSHPANDVVPSFSRDGKWIYFSSNRGGPYQIWKVPSTGGDAIPVTKNIGYVAFESPDGGYLYYSENSLGASPLWRIPTPGGSPVKVLEGVMNGGFAATEKGIYYLDRAPGREEVRLQFRDFTTSQSVTVSLLGLGVNQYLSASPDGRTVLYSRRDSRVDDLMLVENFR